MVGDPSGKSDERNLLDKETLDHNVGKIREQLSQFLDFENGENKAEMVNNYDWFGEMGFLDFIRDVGKHITVNYMMAKDSVRAPIMQAIAEYHRPLRLMLQATPQMEQHRAEADALGIELWFEAFADRCYDDDGKLLSRSRQARYTAGRKCSLR